LRRTAVTLALEEYWLVIPLHARANRAQELPVHGLREPRGYPEDHGVAFNCGGLQ
jgi:hypothetical protein